MAESNRRAIGAAAAMAATVALLSVVGWRLLRPHRALLEPPRVAAAPGNEGDGPGPSLLVADRVDDVELAAERSVEPIVPPPADLGGRPPPESYVRELAGLHGRVVEEDGAPVPDKKVELLKIHIDALLASIEGGFAAPPPELVKFDVASDVTAKDGTFTLKGAEVGSLALLGIDLGGPRGTARVVDVALERGETVDLGDVVLPPHVTFTGTVVDEAGAPLRGARVRVIPQLPVPIPMQVIQVGLQDIRSDSAALVVADGIRVTAEMPGWLRAAFDRLPLPTTTSGGDGRFRLPGIPAGIVTLLVDGKDHLGVVRAGMPSGRSGEHDVGTFELSRGRSVTGQALAGETPIAGARILVGAAIPIPGAPADAIGAIGQPAGVTDGEGRFALDGLPEAGDLLCAIAPHPGDPWTLLGPFPKDDVRLELPPAATLTVIVQDATAAPIAHAELRFLEETPINELPFFAAPHELTGRVREEESGRYVVSELPLGKWIVLARAPGLGVHFESVELTAGGATVTVTLPPARSLQVRVVDAATHAAVDFARVTVLSSELQDFLALTYKAARTNELGEATLDQLPDGQKLALQVTHPGYARALVELPADAATSPAAPVDVALLRGGDLVGRVTHGGEPPTQPVMLVLSHRGDNDVPEDHFPRFGVTLPDGSFRVRHLRAGSWEWNVFPRFLFVEPMALLKTAMGGDPDELAQGECVIEEGKETSLQIDALPIGPVEPAVVRGRVRVDGAPTAGLEVRLMGRRWLDTKSDEAGRFEFAEVRPGPYTLEVRQEQAGGESILHQQELKVASGEARDLDVDVRTIPTCFVVRTSDGTPAAGARVQIVQIRSDQESTLESFSARGSTDPGGRVTIPLRPGRWRAVAHHPSHGYAATTFELPRSSDEPVEIDLVRCARVAGVVELAVAAASSSADEQWAMTLVAIGDSQENDGAFDEERWHGVDPADRRFEFKSVPPGRYKAMLWASGAGQLDSEEFVVGSNDLPNLALHMKATE